MQFYSRLRIFQLILNCYGRIGKAKNGKGSFAEDYGGEVWGGDCSVVLRLGSVISEVCVSALPPSQESLSFPRPLGWDKWLEGQELGISLPPSVLLWCGSFSSELSLLRT